MVLRLAEQLDVPLATATRCCSPPGYAPPTRAHDRSTTRSWRGPCAPCAAAPRRARPVPRRSLSTGTGTSSRPTPRVAILDRRRRAGSCSPRPSTCCGSACTPTAWRRASRTSRVARAPAQPARQTAVADRRPRRCTALHEELRGLSRRRRPAPPVERLRRACRRAAAVRPPRPGAVLPQHDDLFGTPVDVTVAGLAVEAFFPADPETLRALGAGDGVPGPVPL